MTDMRATERLLEVIQERTAEMQEATDISRGDGQRTAHVLMDIEEAITELRRRGDTLVRADDLRVALEVRPGEIGTTATSDALRRSEAMRRLENALGGKML